MVVFMKRRQLAMAAAGVLAALALLAVACSSFPAASGAAARRSR